MNAHLAQELLNELGSSLEALEMRNTALVQFLKDKGIVTDEQLAPYMDQAGNASSVRWRATRVRLQRIFASATEEEEKAFAKLQEQVPKTQAPGTREALTEQPRSTNQDPENATKKTKSKKNAAGEGKREKEEVKKVREGDELKPETVQEKREAIESPPPKVENNAA